ncbi:MAG: NADH-quinone oxidoreductase subunit D [Propionibacteriaceae bacterium]|nr:NADH-quinone oxidoreductase subunit D [Propionibacteriaceae bacterium]
MTSTRILVGSLAAGLPQDAATVVLDLGPDHPSRAGLLEINLQATAGIVTAARILPGAMHRGVEKLFEARDYRQILMLADRHDWQAPFFGELAAVEAFEGMLRLTPPVRATWIRTLLAEHTRILSHLGFLGWLARDEPELVARVRRMRERLRDQFAVLTGNRVHPMAVRIGGMAVDPQEGWLATEQALMAEMSTLVEDLAVLPLPGEGLARVDAGLVDAYGLSGPLARAAGVPLDDRTQGVYAELGFAVMRLGTSGDAKARFALLLDECTVSADIVSACCTRLPEGPVQVRLPKIVKLPEAESYTFVEAPLGRSGFHLVSRGDKTPWRMKLRSPSFHHVAALEEVLVGSPIEQIEVILASIGYVIGDLDK